MICCFSTEVLLAVLLRTYLRCCMTRVMTCVALLYRRADDVVSFGVMTMGYLSVVILC